MTSRNLIFYLIRYLLVVLVFVSIQVHGQTTQTLVGSWTIDFLKTTDRMDSVERIRFFAMSDQAKQMMQKSLEGRIFLFKANGEVTISMVGNDQPKIVKGTWTYSPQHKLMIIAGEQAHSYQVTWRGAQQVLFKQNDISQNGMISTLLFNRK